MNVSGELLGCSHISLMLTQSCQNVGRTSSGAQAFLGLAQPSFPWVNAALATAPCCVILGPLPALPQSVLCGVSPHKEHYLRGKLCAHSKVPCVFEAPPGRSWVMFKFYTHFPTIPFTSWFYLYHMKAFLGASNIA